MKGGLQNPAAFAVQRFFPRDQPVANQLFQNRGAEIPREKVLLCDQYFFNKIRVIQQIRVLANQLEIRDRPILPRGLLQKSE
jgi:hypothetical protein